MSVTNLSNTITYSGDASTTHFPYTFPVQSADDIQVWITDGAGNLTQLTSNFDVDTDEEEVIYPVTGSPLANDGSTITILRVVPLTQETVLSESGPLPVETLEDAFDKLTMALQQMQETLGRTLQYPVGTTPDPTDTETLLARIEAGAGNADAAAASAVEAAASAASIELPLPVTSGGTHSDTELVNGFLMKSAAGKIVESSTKDASVSMLFKYRRPNLVIIDSSHVDVELGIVTGGASDGTILFPDGDIRTEATQGLRRLSIGQGAIFNGENQSGIYGNGGVVKNNNWYACYAVKTTNSDSDWVMLAYDVPPIRENYATLDSAFGTNGWVYLGLIRVGDNSSHPADIVTFTQCGNMTVFTHQCPGLTATGQNGSGITMANSLYSPLSYIYSSGTEDRQIPPNISFVTWTSLYGPSSPGSAKITNSGGEPLYGSLYCDGNTSAICRHTVPAGEGVRITITVTGGVLEIWMSGFHDAALS